MSDHNTKLLLLRYLPPPKWRGTPRKKGELLGSPKTLVQSATGWLPHPSEAGAESQAWDGLWHAVLPGRLVRVMGVRRDANRSTTRHSQRIPPPAIEVYFTTDLALS